ncbi:putative inner membrane protein [compost metagenome]
MPLHKNKTVIYTVFILALFAAFAFINLPFVLPVVLAGIFALGLHDFVNKFCAKSRLPRKLCLWLIFICGLFFFIGPITIAVYRITFYFSQQQDNFQSDALLNQIQALKTFALNHLQSLSDWLGTDLTSPAREMIEKVLNTTGSIILNYSSQVISQLPAILLAIFVFMIVLFAFLSKSVGIWHFTQKYSPFEERLTQRLVDISKRACSVTLFSTFVVGLIQALVIGLGSLIFGEGDFWLVVAITFFVSFIPVIGAAPVGYLLAILAFIHDRVGPGIGLALVATLAGTIDNILKPFMVGGEHKISAIIGFTCVVGAIFMMGLPGLLLGPVIMNLFVGIVPVLIEEMKKA